MEPGNSKNEKTGSHSTNQLVDAGVSNVVSPSVSVSDPGRDTSRSSQSPKHSEIGSSCTTTAMPSTSSEPETKKKYVTKEKKIPSFVPKWEMIAKMLNEGIPGDN